MTMIHFLFSFKGRISRQSFWLFMLSMAAIILIPASFYFGVGNETADKFVDTASLIFLWPVLAVQAKRWHDRDKSAWWILINFIPIIGFFWSLIENGFLRGTDGPNRFGPDSTNPSVKSIPAFGLHGARRKRRAPYLKR